MDPMPGWRAKDLTLTCGSIGTLVGLVCIVVGLISTAG
jgi:hypothetical protein